MKKTSLKQLNVAITGVAIFTCMLFSPGQLAIAQGDETTVPAIISFTIVPTTTVKDGVERQWNEFSWKTEGADKVKFYKDEIELPGRHRLANGEVGWPLSMEGGFKTQSAAIYKLVVENRHGEVSKTLAAKMLSKEKATELALPEVTFNIKATKGNSGTQATFYWQTKGAYQVRLFDSFGEIESRIQLAKGNYGWPLQMAGEFQESLNKSETYKLVATGKGGSVTESFAVTVEEKSCPVVVTVTGKLSEFTEHIAVYQVLSRNSKEFLFKKPVSAVRDNREGKDGATFQRTRLTVPPGDYFFAASGGGKETQGEFTLLYKSEKSNFNCSGGKSGQISFVTNGSEY